MKLIEKLAIDYLKSTRGYDEHYKYSYYQHNYADMREAFKAGFKVARDLMVQKLTKEIGEAGQLTIGLDPNFGEEEVE